ncbi:MAG: chlorophyll A-B-binding protein [Leptolyngbya sp. RL_3_1]|nr:chlorophyll A-B-binding protein [Leptolyngbya sp. RL_3_1]
MVSTQIHDLPQDAQDLLEKPGVSDGSELIPAEAGTQPSSQTAGYTTDQEGLINNHAVMPTPYLQKQPRLGFTEFAERINGRFAMIGFVALLLTEWLTQRSFISILVGSYLNGA